MYYLLGHRLQVEKESFAQDKPAKINDLFKSKVPKNANLCNVYRHYNIKQENKHIKWYMSLMVSNFVIDGTNRYERS